MISGRPGKKELLTNAAEFIDNLKTYDKDHIPDKVINNVKSFIEDENFTRRPLKRPVRRAQQYVCG